MQADPPTNSPTTSPATELSTPANSGNVQSQPAFGPESANLQSSVQTAKSAEETAVTPSTGDPGGLPSPTTFGFTTSQAVMTIVTLVGAILVFQSLRRMNSKGKAPAEIKPTGDYAQLAALRNEIYAKYPPPPKQPRSAPKPPEPQLRLVDDRPSIASNNAEMIELRKQVEQLSQELAHLQSRVKDLEYTQRREVAQPAVPTSFAIPRDQPTQPPSQSTDHENIYRLADRGMSAVEIAKTLGHHTGQVELILNLRRAATGS